MFFEATDGSLYPVSQITRIRPARPKADHDDVHFIEMGESRVEMYSHRVKKLLDLPLSIFPAQPSTYVIRPFFDNGPDGAATTFKTLVIAWGITSMSDIVPITADGPNDDCEDNLAIELPDGSVAEKYEKQYANLDEFISYKRESERKIHKLQPETK